MKSQHRIDGSKCASYYSLTWIQTIRKSWRHLHWWTSALVIWPGKEDKVIRSAALELLVLYCLQMLCLILPYTRVVFANQQLLVNAFIYCRPVRSKLVFGVLDLTRVRELIGPSSRNRGLITIPTVAVHTKRSLLTILLFLSDLTLSLVGVVLLGSRFIEKVVENSRIITFLATKVTRQFRQVLFVRLLFLIL